MHGSKSKPYIPSFKHAIVTRYRVYDFNVKEKEAAWASGKPFDPDLECKPLSYSLK
jgi:hypothetical protein